MSLTLGGGPLSARPPATVNYRLERPEHALFMHPFPRRVRAERGGRTVLDTERGLLLHETRLLPVLYAPVEDFDRSLLRDSDHTTHCPYKGDAVYRTLAAGESVFPDAVWSYPEPRAEAAWLSGLAAMYWDAADAWYDEDERVRGHLRDPYHRVDVRRSARRVRVSLGDAVVALTDRPRVLSETGLPNRLYVPRGDVRDGVLVPGATRAYCPYKGEAAYFGVRLDGRELADAAWCFPDPLKDGLDVRDHVCFLHDELTTEVEPRP
ncbi:DUF427 domain-containing protein [Actinorugispora endophytica]|uniref:Uncharacterized protein (DUF427 family) n=1 Tax=Actinorugispora endophytica TaxID=1605990 RepID=A0A4R6UJ52_9ACTN|nr:DUF427 domain-containing protein [Actinorugispora endophytica]TDQ46851.1 uncharacterized protein (DUF427 family) [Actinorugispora endophytica]